MSKEDQLEANVRIATQLHETGKMSDSAFFKALICFAHEHFVNEDIGGALELLQLIPLEYMQRVLPEQVAEDRVFSYYAAYVSERLLEGGLVVFPDPGVRFTQDPATA